MTTWQDVLRPGDATDFFTRVALPAFDPTTSAYVEGNALWLAELSRLVYRHDIEESTPPPSPTRQNFLDKVGLRQQRFFLCDRTDTQAMLVTSASPTLFAVLVFRGTDSPNDRLTDITVGLQFLMWHKPGLHLGFRRALDSIWPQVEAELATLDCPIFYTGHSLGGALATLAAARRAPKAVYNFGAPRAGNPAFARSIQHLTIHRVVDDLDVVSMLPPAIMGFRHVGQEVRLTAPRSPCALVNPLAWRTTPPALLADHAPVNYIDRMPSARHAIE
ncbi:lipase family protein [Aquabacterium sp.]|uniref:lipase family protein n=1 Tax=Aquabacterium sp. TaxID=1872578 RepID=UPI002487F7A5|nr:lipase family protein [Aquabacterium sp.]MDI1258938.1 lipase family protein [Aquabacterium sp.]